MLNKNNPWAASAILLLFISILADFGCSKIFRKSKQEYLNSGEHFMVQGKYDEASIQFRNALKSDPRYVEAYFQLAKSCEGLQQWDSAFAALQQAEELDPHRLDVHLELGKIYLVARKYSKVDDEANLVLKQDQNNATGYELLAGSRVGQQEYEDALQAFAKLIQLKPAESSPWVNRALVEISLRRQQDAEKDLQKALAVNPHDLEATTDLANLYHVQHDDARALQILEQGLQTNPNGRDLYFTEANILLSQRNKDAAEALLSKLRERDKDSPGTAVALGDFFSNHSQYGQALAEYRRANALSPREMSIKKRIVDADLNVGDSADAASLNSEILSGQPKDVDSRVAQGRILMAQGKTDDSISLLRQTAADAPDSQFAHYYLGLAYSQSGDLNQAKAELEKAVGLAPNSLPVLASMVKLEMQLSEPDVALEYAKRAALQHPEDSAAHELVGIVLLEMNHLNQAEAEIQTAMQIDPNDPAIHFHLGLTLARQQHWADEEKEFEDALRLNPRFTDALAKEVDIWVDRNQRDKAAARVRQFVAQNPANADAHAILGSLLLQAKNYGEATNEFERAVQLNPKLVQAYLQLGRIQQDQGQPDSALPWFQKALALQPRFAPLQTLIGNIYLDKNDLDQARKYFESALESDPNFAVASANLAWVYARQGQNLDVALGLAQKAKGLMPNLDSITDTLAWVEYKKGAYESAVPLLEECVQKAPESGRYRYHLGMALLATGEKDKGKAELEAALRMNLPEPDAQEVRRALAR